MTLDIREGSETWGCYTFRPPDPIWAPSATIARARRQLRDFDVRLGLWWSPMRQATWDPETPGRWRIVEWLPNKGIWTTVFYVEGPDGQYRLPDCIDAILRRLGPAIKPLDELDEEIERRNAERAKKERHEKLRTLLEHHLDVRERELGIRQTFGAGHIRPRNRLLTREQWEKTNHAGWLREKGMT